MAIIVLEHLGLILTAMAKQTCFVMMSLEITRQVSHKEMGSLETSVNSSHVGVIIESLGPT